MKLGLSLGLGAVGRGRVTGGGPTFSRTTSGLLTVGGTTANPHDAADWTAGPITTSISVVSGILRQAVSSQSGTQYQPIQWDISPTRTKRWVQARYMLVTSGGNGYVGFGVGVSADGDYIGQTDKILDFAVGPVVRAVDARLHLASNQFSLVQRAADTLYRNSIKVEDSLGTGLTATVYDFGLNETRSLTSTVLGNSAPVAFCVQDARTGGLGEIWDMSDWVVTVNGLETGEIARIVNEADATVASATESAGSAAVDLHAANATVENCVKIGVRNPGDTAWVWGPVEPTDAGPNSDEPGIHGGDVWTVA